MVRLKWILSLTIVMLLVVTIIGCSNNNNTSESDDKNKIPVNEVSTEVAEFSFSFWGGTIENDSYVKLIDQFNTLHPNIKVTPMYIPDDYNTKLNALAASNTTPDIIKIQASQIFPWSDSKRFADMTALHESDAFGKKLDYLGFRNSEGKVIGYSSNNEIITMYYNKEIFDEANIPYPPTRAEDAWTWEEFIDVSKKLTTDRNGKHPGEAGFDPENIKTYGVNMTRNYINIQPFLNSAGGGIISKDHKVILDSPESIDALQKIADLSNVHMVMPKPSQSSVIPTGDAALLTKMVAMSIDGQWSLQVLGKAMAEKGLKLGMGVLPKLKDPITVNTGSAIAVVLNANTKKFAAEAELFYTYVMDPENIFELIETGLAMPNAEKWFTEPDLISKWVDNKYHPAEYKEAVVDYGLNNVKQLSGFYWDKDSKAQSIILPALDQLWLGKKTAEDVVKNDIMPKLKQELNLP